MAQEKEIILSTRFDHDNEKKNTSTETHLLVGAKAEAEAARTATIRTCFIIVNRNIGVNFYFRETLCCCELSASTGEQCNDDLLRVYLLRFCLCCLHSLNKHIARSTYVLLVVV